MLSTEYEPKEELFISKLLNQGIISVESALFYYGYSDFTPRVWSITIPRSYSRTIKKIQKEFSVKGYYVQNDVYSIGKTTGLINGVVLPIYDRERTICDCFKYRTKLDNEMFNKAVKAYALDQNKNIEKLSEYAKQLGLYEKIMNVMEVLLND